MKVMVFSHAHPAFSKGGGELAAWYLCQEIDRQPDHSAWFVGCADPALMHRFSSLAALGERNYLLAGTTGIAELTAGFDLGPDGDLASLLRRVDPDVVHFHHYVHVGLETIRLVKRVCPRARIVMTLHEYIALCMNNGQMLTTDGRLCHRPGPRECHRCFPHVAPEEFFLRERWIKSYFGLVDLFVSPSRFLRERYANWGLAPERVVVIENGLPAGDRLPPRALGEGEVRTRFAYFGQINPYKGVDVILEAFAQLPKAQRKRVSLDIFGSGLERQPAEFRNAFNERVKKLNALVHLHGAYEPEELPRLMRDIDWVVMGSIWWENSPLVIQEAFKFGRPVITPDIGGMAEKVKPGQGGLNYRARDSVSLAALVRRVVAEPALFDSLVATLPDYPKIEEVAREHLNHYRALGEQAPA